MSIPNQLSVIQHIRPKYPTPLGTQHPFFLIEVAQATGARLLRKDGGTHVTLPTGVNVSQDILMFGDQGIDILSDGEGAAIPSWQEKGTIPGEYIDVGFIPQPVPNPGPIVPNPGTPAPVVDLSAVLVKLDEVIAAIDFASTAEIAKLDEIKAAFIKGSGEIGKVLAALAAGGGLGGVLGGILGGKK